MKAPTQINREMNSTLLSVSGLCITVIGLLTIFDKLDAPILCSLLLGSSASILNRYLYLYSKQVLQKHSPDSVMHVCLFILRITPMSFIVCNILVLPIFNSFFGVSALLFSPLSRIAACLLKKSI